MNTGGLAHRVVIVGGGFGGLYLAKSLRRAPVRVTIIDRRNFHLFQPLLYQVATGGLSPANIAAPIRYVLKRYRNTEVVLGDVSGFDVARRRVILETGEYEYDTLVVAAGVRPNYFGNDHWAAHAPGLKTLEDATDIRRRVLLAFENAERETDPGRARSWLTFAVVGGGPTGVELAGTLAEIARQTLRREFRRINPADASIQLIEAGERILECFPPELSDKAADALRSLGVSLRTRTRVVDIRPGEVTLKSGEVTETIRVQTTLWSAGIAASPLGAALAAQTGCQTDRIGRIPVEPDCSIAGHPSIFVIGDLAVQKDAAGKPLPGVAPVAMQQGRYVARLIVNRLRDKPMPSFRYLDKGNMATIGRAHAVADIGGLRLSGYLAWLAWLFIHLIFLIEFQNRVLVLIQWAWNYLTWSRSARLITGRTLPEDAPSPPAASPGTR